MSEQLAEVTYSREQRLYDDTTTWLAEVLDGYMRTPFEYRFDGHELYGRDGSPLKPIFTDAISHAEKLGPNLSFEHRRRHIEMNEYDDMIAMAKGELSNTMVVISDFPPELMDANQNIGGYNVSRKQTMLRVISRNKDGDISMRSQSLDRSDRKGLEAIYQSLGFKPEPGELLSQRIHLDLLTEQQEFLVDSLMGEYDRSLGERFGGEWYAGRKAERCVNTYDFVREQQDLLDVFISTTQAKGEIDEDLLFNLAAAMKYRFDTKSANIEYIDQSTSVAPPNVHVEMQIAGQQARSEGQTFSGCGATIGDKQQSTLEELNETGYGNKTDGKESWTWKSGVCRVEACPTRPGKTEVGPCSVCRKCQAKFDAGKDPTKS